MGLLREYAEEHGDSEIRSLARLIEIGEYQGLGFAAEPDGAWLRGVQRDSHEWRLDTIGDDITPTTQLAHTRNEIAELSDPLVKGATYDGAWTDGEEEHLKTEAGDVIVAYLGVLSLLGFDAVECMNLALEKNGQRSWEEHKTEVHADD